MSDRKTKIVNNIRSSIKKEYDLTIEQMDSIVKLYCSQYRFKSPTYASNWKPDRLLKLKYEFAGNSDNFSEFINATVKKYI